MSINIYILYNIISLLKLFKEMTNEEKAIAFDKIQEAKELQKKKNLKRKLRKEKLKKL